MSATKFINNATRNEERRNSNSSIQMEGDLDLITLDSVAQSNQNFGKGVYDSKKDDVKLQYLTRFWVN